MYLKSLTLKGFKSFPERTRLEFGPGISVVVGPNGSGKSNITDSVLWAFGEQSSLAVRGSSMQDVIFGGGPGVQARSAAEVELVLDNADGTVDMPDSEISILRRLERSGEGEYRLGGARCRLVDVIEALSDTGLGKETHSVVSQGRIESIVTSKPRDRRLLLEEAAGLGKHRTRRRRAQLKLERTQLNVDRALDIEREARSRLRPLARHAQAAELHERLERQSLEARLELARHSWLASRIEHDQAQTAARYARASRLEIEAELQAAMVTRANVERGLAERAEQHDALTDRLYGARSALERMQLRADQIRTLRAALQERITSGEAELAALQTQSEDDRTSAAATAGEARVDELVQELAQAQARYEAETSQQADARVREHAARKHEYDTLREELDQARALRGRERAGAARLGDSWQRSWTELRGLIIDGLRRALTLGTDSERELAAAEVAQAAERIARAAVERALDDAAGATGDDARDGDALAELERRTADAAELERRARWLVEQHAVAAEGGSLAVRCAALGGELAAERRLLQVAASEHAERSAQVARVRARNVNDHQLAPLVEHLLAVLEPAITVTGARIAKLEGEFARDRGAGDEIAARLTACAQHEAEIQGRLRSSGEGVTVAEVALQRTGDRFAEAAAELAEIVQRLQLGAEAANPESAEPLGAAELEAIELRLARLARRREQLGPVNPLAQSEYADAQAHVAELATSREDLEVALRELRAVIRETDRHIRESFQATFDRVATNFAEVIQEVFPGGSGRLRLVEEDLVARAVIGDAVAAESADSGVPVEQLLGVEI
jgi:chromosome segregation ATPase